jgi:hypothetical protein
MDIVIKFIGFLGLIVVFAIILSIPTMILWNWLMPTIFGLIEIDIWQALGLNILFSILFKSSKN